MQEDNRTGLEIAVVGMAGRFPGAENIDEFRENLIAGRESIDFFSPGESEEAGVDREVTANPAYVNACGRLEGVEYFDAPFFGYSPLEAGVLDPQMRLFHECAYEALENAGYDPYSYDRSIGIYAGVSTNFNWWLRTGRSGKLETLGWFLGKHLIDKNFAAARVAHQLHLKGPAVTMDTACSSSLTALHMACQGLLSGDCDAALAGGVSVFLLEKKGYLYEEGLLQSPDGHCRAFDARAKGTNTGDGVGTVVLKRLDDAERDGDTIHAVVKGSSINNDGGGKASFEAPGVAGQARVIRAALRAAGVKPETIGYIEAHGTGTTLGDPVEIEGLKLAFNTPKKHFCRIGSVKTNIGHLAAASGITAFIKTVLVLKHRLIPPSLFFETPNPKIDFENSPFIVNTRPTEWKRTGHPLRAGVNSFGIGGTNAHAVLEEWPEDRPPDAERRAQGAERECHLILLSAKTGTALEKMSANLAGFLKKNPGSDLADIAYTLQVGRRVYKHRRMLVCSSTDGAVELLSSPGPGPKKNGDVESFSVEEDNRPIVFKFPEPGPQFVDMCRDLYRQEPQFREEADRCFNLPDPPGGDNRSDRSDRSDKTYTSYSNPLPPVFIIQYALARLLVKWGVKPAAATGTGPGEYAAACISGDISPEEAIKRLAHGEQTPPRVRRTEAPPDEPGTLVVEIGPRISNGFSLWKQIGRLWLHGQPIDWTAVYTGEKNQKKRVPLPTYPFDRQRHWIRETPAPATPHTEPALTPGKTREVLTHTWAEFFGLDRVGRRDNFFQLGGDSLKARLILLKIRKRLNVEIPIAEFFKHPTIEELARFIDGAGETPCSPIEAVEEKEYYPLSHAQKRLYFLYRMDPHSTVYNEFTVTPLTGDFTPREIERIFRVLIQRHESLRTSFHVVDGEPVQTIHRDVAFGARNYEIDAADASIRDIIEDFKRPFELSKAPLIRVGLVGTGPGEHFLMVDMHHIITDMTSKQIIAGEVAALHGGETLPPLPARYRDYTLWQHGPLQQEILRKQEAYWLKCFQGGVPRLNLPFNYPRTEGYGAMGYVGGAAAETTARRLTGISKSEGTTLFMVFLALYTIFLSKITGTEDVVTGTLTLGRGHPGLEGIVGMFVNTLVLRHSFAGALTFREFLRDVRDRTLEAFENQDYPFEHLVDRLGAAREPGGNPLFDAAYSYYAESRQIPGETASPAADAHRGEVRSGVLDTPSKFDLILTVSERKEGPALSLTYNAKLFKEETVKRFFSYFNHICAAVSEDPAIELRKIVIDHRLTAVPTPKIEDEEGDFSFS